MHQPTLDTVLRPRNLSDRRDPAVLYVRSYLLIRTVVGLMGTLLPLALIAGESWIRGGPMQVGSSLSSYYHTSMRDVFVGALCIMAVLLATYLAGRPWTWDFWLSLLAGLALLGVVFFPIGRPGIPAGAPRCTSTPTPAGCSPLEQVLGEVRTEHVHLIAAGTCFLLLAVLSFRFARQERAHGGSLTAASFHGMCGVVVLLGIAAAGASNYVDYDLGPLPLLFAGETAAVWAFAASWLLAGRDLWLRLLRPRRGGSGAHRAERRRGGAQGRMPLDPPAAGAPAVGAPAVDAPPSPRSTPGTNGAPDVQHCGFYPDPYAEEPYPWTEWGSDDHSSTASTRTAVGPSVASGPAPAPDVVVPQSLGSSGRREGLPGVSSADLPVERYEPGPVDEQRAMVEVVRLATVLTASSPDGDLVLARRERSGDVRPGADPTTPKPWDQMPGEPMWFVGVCMWSWCPSTPGTDRGRSLSANLVTFVDANGAPVAPSRPDARFRGSYRLLAEALRERMSERSTRTSAGPFPVVEDPVLRPRAGGSDALGRALHLVELERP